MKMGLCEMSGRTDTDVHSGVPCGQHCAEGAEASPAGPVALPLCCSSVHNPTQASSHTHSLIELSGQLEECPASPLTD